MSENAQKKLRDSCAEANPHRNWTIWGDLVTKGYWLGKEYSHIGHQGWQNHRRNVYITLFLHKWTHLSSFPELLIGGVPQLSVFLVQFICLHIQRGGAGLIPPRIPLHRLYCGASLILGSQAGSQSPDVRKFSSKIDLVQLWGILSVSVFWHLTGSTGDPLRVGGGVQPAALSQPVV